MRKIKFSNLCKKAANERLWDGVNGDISSKYSLFSCVAIELSAAPFDSEEARLAFIEPYVSATGVPESGYGFDDIADIETRQGARYMLLLFASHYFKDAGY